MLREGGAMSFHLLSDLHIQRAPFELTKPPNCECDYLILAGDIGEPDSKEYQDLIKHASNLYEHVILIKGNHECHVHHRTLEETDVLINSIASLYSNVTYLHNSAIELAGFRIVGTTLWSLVKPEQEVNVKCFISDYRYIKNWSVEQNNAEHRKAVAYIHNELNTSTKPIIIVTHHAPFIIGTANPMHIDSPLKSAYATDLSEIIRSPAVVWCYGHTHWSNMQTVNGVQLISNQRGLPYESEMSGFNPHFVVNTKTKTNT